MDLINVHIIGPPYVEWKDARVNFPYKKAEALFYYLCVQKSAGRDQIVQILWDESTEASGRKNLREAIYQIRKLFGNDILVTEGNHTVSLNPQYLPKIDWDSLNSDTVLECSHNVVLEHFYVKHSYAFEEWMNTLREQFTQLYAESARQKLYHADAAKDIQKIQHYANLLIRQDPYNEDLYYEAMDIYAVNGCYGAAIKLYSNLSKLLKEELDVEPSPKVTQLYQRISNMEEGLPQPKETKANSFFGRSEELYMITEDFFKYCRGESDSCNYIIQGESGVGKTALLDCLTPIIDAQNFLILRTSCYKDETDFFLRPWRDIFRTIVQYDKKGMFPGISDKMDYMQKSFITGLDFGEELRTGYFTYQRLEETILSLFAAITQHTPVALFIDDIQWMDSMSFQLLNRILLTAGLDKIILFASSSEFYREKIADSLSSLFQRDLIRFLYLHCFTLDETRQIIEEKLPQLELTDGKLNKLYQLTHGNAFFLYESISLIQEKGYTLELTPKAATVIHNRLLSLSDDELTVLNCISIFPEKVCVKDIRLLMPLSQLEILECLENLQKRHLIQETTTDWNVYYSFVHGMLKDYVYEHQSTGRRTQYHQILAEYYENALCTQNHLSLMPLIIYHYERARNQLKTYQYKVHYLHDFYTVVHESFPILDTDVEYTQEFLGIMPTSIDMVALAQEIIQWNDYSPEANKLKMEMYYIIGRYDISVGEYEQGIPHLQKAMDLSHQLDDISLRLNCYKQMLFYGIQVQKPEILEEYLEKAFALIQPEENPYQYGVFLRQKGIYHIIQKDYDNALKVLNNALHIFENKAPGHRRHSMNIAACYNYIGDVWKYQKEYETAYSYYQTAIKTNTEKIVTNGLGQFYSNAGQMLFWMKDYTQAQIYLEKSLSLLQKYGYQWGLERVLAYLSLLKLTTGKKEEALDYYEQACTVSRKIRNPETEALLEKLKCSLS